jgi:hypothetical protein
MLVRKSFFLGIGGFDESLGNSWNDTDFGIRVIQSGRSVIYTPFALLLHHEGGTRRTRATDDTSPQEMETLNRFKQKQHKFIEQGDPFYNPNLSLDIQYMPKWHAVTNPQSILFWVYQNRQELKNAFPEVSRGDFRRLYHWAGSINMADRPDPAWPILRRYQEWYQSKYG